MQTLRIELLGGLRLIRDDVTISRFKSQKAASLLAYIACHPDREHPRERLVDLLWPEADVDAGRVRLRTVLSQLRELLSDDAGRCESLQSSRFAVWWRPGSLTTDVGDLAHAVRMAEATEDDAKRARILESALAASFGELLPGFYDDWVQRERDRLAAVRRAALDRLARAHERMGDLPRAIESLRLAIAEDPLREETHCEIMRLGIAMGQPAAALAQFAVLSQLLKEELEAEPCANALALAASARAGSGVRRPPRPVMKPGTIDAESAPGAAAEPRRALRWSPAAWIAGCAVVVSLAGIVAWKGQATSARSPERARSLSGQAAGGAEIWRSRYRPADGESRSDPQAIVAGSDGSLIVTGFVRTSDTDVDFLTAKFDAAGKQVWANRYNGPGNDVDRARSIALTAEADIYVLGDSDNGRGNVLTRLSGLDLALVKYGRNGEKRWERRWNGGANGEEWAVQVLDDGTGGAYVLGNSLGRNGDAPGHMRFVLIRYDRSGSTLWTRLGPKDGASDAVGMTLTSEGAICVAGSRISRSGGESDAYAVCYDRDGRMRWQREFGRSNAASDWARAIARDPASGTLYLAGIGRIGSAGREPARPTWFVVALDERGTVRYRSGSDADSHRLRSLYSFSAAPHGHLYLLGEHVLADGLPGYRLVKLEPAGGVDWARDKGLVQTVPAVGGGIVLSDVSGGAYVSCIDAADLGQKPAEALNFLTRKLDAAGALRWERAYDYERMRDMPHAMVFDPRDGVVVAGQSEDRAGLPEMTLIKYRR